MNCQEHSTERLRYICTQCNVMLCGRCILIHKVEENHIKHCLHIDDIRGSIKNNVLQKNDNTIQTDKVCFTQEKNYLDINKMIESSWESCKLIQSKLNSLESIEKDIKNHFDIIHNQISVQERSMAKPILEDKDTLNQLQEKSINSIKYLLNIIKLNILSQHQTEQPKEQQMEQQNIPDGCSFEELERILESQESIIDIMPYISEYPAIFDKNNNYLNFVEQLERYDKDSDSLILELIHKYKELYPDIPGIKDVHLKYNFNTFKLSIKQPDEKQIGTLVRESICFESKTNSTKTILSTEKGKPTETKIIDTNMLGLDFNFGFKNSSFVAVGSDIYLFSVSNRWVHYSTKSKSVEHIGEIEGIITDNSDLSVCHDGRNYIYIFNVVYLRIERLNLQTKIFETFHVMDKDYGVQVSSLIHNGSLYSVGKEKNAMFILKLSDKMITERRLPNKILPIRGSHDDSGNFYLRTIENEFYKYNIDTDVLSHGDPKSEKYFLNIMF